MTVVVLLHERTTEPEREELAARGLRVLTPTLATSSASPERVRADLEGLPHVGEVVAIPGDYPRASMPAAPGGSTVTLGDTEIGGNGFTVIAGPCSVETPEQMLTTARAVSDAGAHALRGGIFKPRTSPYAFQGLGRDGFELARQARDETGLPFVTEIVDVRDIEPLHGTADMFQVGARNMQNYALLRELGRTRIPVLLKRGLSATVDETLMAAEYLLDGGNEQVVLCERGIRTFETSYRFTLDLTAVTVLRERTHLPVIVDPSHAAGARDRVTPLALAAAACGADGIIVESHCDPSVALCDGKQALPTSELPNLMARLRPAAFAAGHTLTPRTVATTPRVARVA